MRVKNYVKYYFYLVLLVVAAHLYFQHEPSTLVLFHQLSAPVVVAVSFLLTMEKASEYGYGTTFGRTLKLFGIGIGLWLFGEVVWLLYQQVMLISALPYPSIADIGYLSFYIPTIIAMLYFFENMKARFSPKRLLKALPIPFLALIFVLFYIVGPVSYQSDIIGLRESLSIAYPTLDALTLFLASFFLLLLRKETITAGAKLLFSGYITFAIADLLFIYSVLNNTFYTGGPASILYVIAFGMMGIGAAAIDEDVYEIYGTITGLPPKKKPVKRKRRRKRRRR